MKKGAGKLLGLLIVCCAFAQHISAQGNLLVAPIRVVFENGNTKEDLNLTNIGQDTAIYLISYIQNNMLPDGSFKQVENPDTLTTKVDKFVRIVPRKVTLPPGQSQTVRLQYRKTADMKSGEYRSHLYFRAEKDVTALGMSTNKADSGSMSVSITPIFGISIPVIIREGTLNYKTTLSDVVFTPADSVSFLSVKINRTGNRSSYGNLRVEFVPNSGASYIVTQANGVGVYTNITSRSFVFQIRNQPGRVLKNGKLVIRYMLSREEGEAELSKVEFQIP